MWADTGDPEQTHIEIYNLFSGHYATVSVLYI